jgi:hypothetical protein
MAHLGYRTTNWTRIQNSNTSKKKKTRGEYDFEIVVTDNQRRTISRETVWVDSFDEAVAIARSKKYEVPKDHTVHCDGVEVSFFG